MHSQRQVVAALLSSVISQVLAILLLLPSSFTSSSSTSSFSSSSSSLLCHHLSILLVFLTTTTTTSSSCRDASSPSSSVSQSPPSSSTPRKKKRRRLQFENNSSNGRSQQHQQQRQEEGGGEGLRSHFSSSTSSPSTRKLDEAIFSTSSPSSFKLHFRMTSTTFEWLSGLLEPLLECRDPVGSSLNLSPHLRLGIGLFRLASGSPYSDISRRFSVSEPTAKFCTKQLCRVLCTNFRFWVAFPNPPELQSVSSAFQDLSGFPNCCGIIECTRFEILGGERIASQIIVDPSSRILNIATGFRGTKDEYVVLQSSALYKDVQEGHLLGSFPSHLKGVAIPQYLIGGQAYPLLPWLMVPFVQPTKTPSEDDFNAVHRSMRGPALRALASLRNWGILSRPIEEEEVNMAVACIGACSILHNVLLMREDFSALSDATDDHSLHDRRDSRESSLVEGSNEKASAIRNALAARAEELRANLIQRNEQQQ